MATPQRKVWSGWVAPGSEKNGSGSGNLDLISSPRGKGIASNGRIMDRDFYIDTISKLEKELNEYQYNMGLLLIEKKESVSKNEQLQRELCETKELLHREQTVRNIAASEVEKRDETLRNALGVEKQCVHELEKALHDLRAENAEIKFTAESKLEEANALSISIEEKSLKAEVKLREADAKLAEVSRKTSDIQRKSAEFEAKERSILRERVSFKKEREAHERDLLHQREDLREWERKLQEGEQRLAEVRRLLNQREDRANENDTVFKRKNFELEETIKKTDLALKALQTKEDDMGGRIGNLTLKEKEAEAMRNHLETKEKELMELEKKLKAREEVLAKREQSLESKLEKFKENEKEFDLNLKSLKEREKSLKVEEKNVEIEKEKLLVFETELRKLKTAIEEQRCNVVKEQERLKLTEEERAEHTRLQLELKHEIGKNKHEKEAFLKDRAKFEKEWEDLDEKRAEILRESDSLVELKKMIEKSNQLETKMKSTPDRPIGEPFLGSPMTSWLRKCTSKVFIFSVGKKNELKSDENGSGSAQAQENLVDVGEIPEYVLSSEDEPEGSARCVASENNEESRGEPVGRKRNRKEREGDPELSENSDKNSDRGWRNRRRKVGPIVEAPRQKRYNLRRPKTVAPTANGGALSNPSEEEEVNGVGINVRPEPSTSLANGNHVGDSQANEFLQGKLAQDTVSCHEINETPNLDRERSNGRDEIESSVAQEEEVEGSEDEVEHPGEVSIGRKLWTFIST